jgi:hypothetical protein
MPETGSWETYTPKCSQHRSLWFHSCYCWRYTYLFSVWWSDIRKIDAKPAMSDNGASVVNLSAPQQWHTTLDLRASPVTFRNGGSPLATTTVVVAELLGLCFPSASSLLRSPLEHWVLPHPQRRRCSHFQLTQNFAVAMSNWTHSNVSREQLLRRFESIWMPTLNVSLCLGTVNPAFQGVFQNFPLQIWNATLHESCVPQQDLQLS